MTFSYRSASYRVVRPNRILLREAMASYKIDEEFNLSGYSADYMLCLAVYDPIGGFPARVNAEESNFMEQFHTRVWFSQRAQGLIPSEIVLSQLLEEENW